MRLMLKSLFKTTRLFYRLVDLNVDKDFSDNVQPADGHAGRPWWDENLGLNQAQRGLPTH